MSEAWTVMPAPGRVAVKLSIPPSVSEGGIFFPITHQAPTSGEVYASCAPYELEGEDYQPLYAPGDIVMFGPYTGTTITVGRDQVIVLKERDIIARLVPAGSSTANPSHTLAHIKVNDV